MTLPQAVRWKVASDKEIASMEKHGVYEVVPIILVPGGRKVVGTRWVYKIKADGVYKGGLVVLGWSQVPGVDCGGPFAPVYRLQSIRMVLVIAAELDYEVCMLDVQTAFATLTARTKFSSKWPPATSAATSPEFYSSWSSRKASSFSSRARRTGSFSTMDHHLGKIGYHSLKSDPCVYVYEDENGPAILTLYVDDVLLLGCNKQLLNKLKKQFIYCFEMTDMDDELRILGMNVTRDREEGTITINQKDYTED